jgi:hypothetical protein
MDFRRSLEMSLSREEFFRLLPAAVGEFEADGDSVRGAERNGTWVIRLIQLADHRVGSVAIARHRVEISVEALTEAEAEAFMDRFHRGFLRGGG